MGKDYKILGQYHKKTVIPTDYIALVGDSHALGSGDWYLEAVKKHKFTQGDYHSAHILFNKTGRDVLSFGSLGADSLRGLVLSPISHFKYFNSLRNFKLKQPKEILVYFYEGNDLSENALSIDTLFRSGYAMDRLYSPEYFKTFIEKEILGTDLLYTGKVPFKNWLFCRFLIESVGDNVYNEVNRGIKKLKKIFLRTLGVASAEAEIIQVSPDFSGKVSIVDSDLALINGKEFAIPYHTQQPCLHLSAEQTKQGVYVFEQSLKYMAEFFNESKITLVYIPSPPSVYKWISPTVTFLMGKKITYSTAKIYQRSDEIFQYIQTLSIKYNYPLIDTRPFLRTQALKEPLHGPRDWYHPNRKGYEAITEVILKNTSLGARKIRGEPGP